MIVKNFFRNKKIANGFFVTVLLPYILLCLTMGGFHNGINNTKHCGGVPFAEFNNTSNEEINAPVFVSYHDSESCQICQWLKTHSIPMRFLLPESRPEYLYSRDVSYSNPDLSSFFTHKFAIRPPPYFFCIS